MLNDKAKAILIRLAKGFIAGASGALVSVVFTAPTSWETLLSTLNVLAIAGVAGGISGLILAIHKWANWTDTYGVVK
jgi:hypothetical protein